MKYNAPQIEVIRFETEEILNSPIISGTQMDEGVAEGGFRPFGNGNSFQIP